MHKRVFFFLACSIACLFISGALQGAQEGSQATRSMPSQKAAAPEETGGRFLLYGDVGGRYNPRGAGISGGINYRDVYRYDKEKGLETAYWQTGVGMGISPSAAVGRVHLEWMPWIVLPLRVEYDYYRFLGASYGLLSYNSARASLCEDGIGNRQDQEAANGHRFLFQPTLQGKIGPVILRNQTDLAYYYFSGRGPYFLELEYFTLLKDGDWLVSNRTQALVELWKGEGKKTLLSGPYYEVTRAGDAQITQQKIGALLYWAPMEKLASLGRPHVGLKMGYHWQDPEWQGQLYVILGVGFEYEFR